jgi:hypothetical protein
MYARRHITLPFIFRIGLGLVWLAGAAFNAVSTLPHPETFRDDLGQNSTFAVYRWFFDSVVGSAPVFWSILLILAEVLLGILLLGRDPWARYGLILSTAWCVFLFFVIWPYTLSTVPLLALSVWLLRYPHPDDIFDVVHRRPD